MMLKIPNLQNHSDTQSRKVILLCQERAHFGKVSAQLHICPFNKHGVFIYFENLDQHFMK